MNTDGDGFCKLCCWLHPLLSPQDYKGTHGQKASVTSVQTLASRTTKWAGKFIPSVSYQPGTDSWKPQQRQGTIGWNFRSFKPLPRKSSLKICSWTVAKTRIFFRLFSLQNLLWALWAHYSRWRLMVWNSNRRLELQCTSHSSASTKWGSHEAAVALHICTPCMSKATWSWLWSLLWLEQPGHCFMQGPLFLSVASGLLKTSFKIKATTFYCSYGNNAEDSHRRMVTAVLQ